MKRETHTVKLVEPSDGSHKNDIEVPYDHTSSEITIPLHYENHDEITDVLIQLLDGNTELASFNLYTVSDSLICTQFDAIEDYVLEET